MEDVHYVYNVTFMGKNKEGEGEGDHGSEEYYEIDARITTDGTDEDGDEDYVYLYEESSEETEGARVLPQPGFKFKGGQRNPPKPTPPYFPMLPTGGGRNGNSGIFYL